MDKLAFRDENGNLAEFAVEAEVRLGGVNYLLVSEDGEDEAEALILKDVSAPGSEEANLAVVDDDREIRVLKPLFEEALGDTDLEI